LSLATATGARAETKEYRLYQTIQQQLSTQGTDDARLMGRLLLVPGDNDADGGFDRLYAIGVAYCNDPGDAIELMQNDIAALKKSGATGSNLAHAVRWHNAIWAGARVALCPG
jgi:hypothetical protein